MDSKSIVAIKYPASGAAEGCWCGWAAGCGGV